ncbi:MAG: twin-arginine translocase subunit TatC [Planctomycetaceae bacterium]
MTNSKDLFDETTMSFGEHLEALRIHLWKAIIGFVVAVVICLFFGSYIVAFIRGPISNALHKYNFPPPETDSVADFDFIEYVQNWFSGEEQPVEKQEQQEQIVRATDPETVVVSVKQVDLYNALKSLDPSIGEKIEKPDDEKTVLLPIKSEEFSQLRRVVEKSSKTVALNVQEAFMTYLKVSMMAGFVLSSPWIFYQLWLFVAAGLYPHEKRYVHFFLPISVGLFVGGALFCFYFVFPTVLDFLLQFNKSLGVDPQIRLSEWISFAIFLPMMFGISFQLPLVMLFLERIQVFSKEQYRENRRMSILIIAFLSMMLTPSDPTSMILMMIPLLILYEVGIKMCDYTRAPASPFQEEAA